jgi:hypothetical protein
MKRGTNLAARLVVLVATMACAAVVVPGTRGDVIDTLLQSALSDLVAWDPGFAPFADPPPSGHDFVAGSQKVTAPNGDFQHIRISAHSDSQGNNPQGQVQVTYRAASLPGGAGDVRGNVICLNMFGPGFLIPPTAFVWARLSQAYLGYTYVQLQIHDVGDPGPFMGQSPDEVRWLLSSIGPGPDCGSNGTTLVGDARGNFVIRNAP